MKYVDVVYVNIEGRHESVLYVEVNYVDEKTLLPCRENVIATPHPMFYHNMKDIVKT